jgi:hypothetical protein
MNFGRDPPITPFYECSTVSFQSLSSSPTSSPEIANPVSEPFSAVMRISKIYVVTTDLLVGQRTRQSGGDGSVGGLDYAQIIYAIGLELCLPQAVSEG